MHCTSKHRKLFNIILGRIHHPSVSSNFEHRKPTAQANFVNGIYLEVYLQYMYTHVPSHHIHEEKEHMLLLTSVFRWTNKVEAVDRCSLPNLMLHHTWCLPCPHPINPELMQTNTPNTCLFERCQRSQSRSAVHGCSKFEIQTGQLECDAIFEGRCSKFDVPSSRIDVCKLIFEGASRCSKP